MTPNTTEKIELIKQYLNPITVAFDTYLKQVDALIKGAPLTDKDIDIAQIQGLQADYTRYEKLRNKLLCGDFSLSPAEISSVGLIIYYQSQVISKQIETLKELNSKTEAIYKELLKVK